MGAATRRETRKRIRYATVLYCNISYNNCASVVAVKLSTSVHCIAACGRVGDGGPGVEIVAIRSSALQLYTAVRVQLQLQARLDLLYTYSRFCSIYSRHRTTPNPCGLPGAHDMCMSQHVHVHVHVQLYMRCNHMSRSCTACLVSAACGPVPYCNGDCGERSGRLGRRMHASGQIALLPLPRQAAN